MTVIARNESKGFVTVPRGKSLRCQSYEDTLREMEAFLDGKLDNPQTGQDGYVDITEPINPTTVRMPAKSDPDATENSSSFGDTTSINEIASGTSDAEVESEFRADGGMASLLDSYSNVIPMRRKKLTTQWRSFVRPLMWRCKWTELKIKELESQALKYTRKLEANDQAKMLELHQYTSDFCSKSFPFSSHSVKRKHMKRRKRKPVENVSDISSYMSRHHLFSYLENKKPDQDGLTNGDDDGTLELHSKNCELSMDDEWLKDGETSFEQILGQIETVQSQVHNLRNHLDAIMLKNGVKLSSSQNVSLLAPYDAQTSAAQSPTLSIGNGDNMIMGAMHVPHSLSDFDIEDLDLPDSIVSGYIDGTQIPDVIESTVGLLSAADVTMHQPQIMESGENVLDNTPTQSKVTQDGNITQEVIDQATVVSNGTNSKEHNISSLPVRIGLVPDPLRRDAMTLETTLKSCVTAGFSVPKNKKKRGERKAGPVGWNLKCSGQPDNN